MCYNNVKTSIDALYNVLLAPDLCDWLFSIITLINLVHTCLFHRYFCKVFFSDNKHNTVTLLYSAQKKGDFLVRTKENSKSQKQIPKNKVSLELLNHRLGNRYTRLLLAGYNAIFWQDIEIRIYPDPFCTSCQISTINKKSISKTPLNPKTPFKWVLIDIVSATSPQSLTK